MKYSCGTTIHCASRHLHFLFQIIFKLPFPRWPCSFNSQNRTLTQGPKILATSRHTTGTGKRIRNGSHWGLAISIFIRWCDSVATLCELCTIWLEWITRKTILHINQSDQWPPLQHMFRSGGVRWYLYNLQHHLWIIRCWNSACPNAERPDQFPGLVVTSETESVRENQQRFNTHLNQQKSGTFCFPGLDTESSESQSVCNTSAAGALSLNVQGSNNPTVYHTVFQSSVFCRHLKQRRLPAWLFAEWPSSSSCSRFVLETNKHRLSAQRTAGGDPALLKMEGENIPKQLWFRTRASLNIET